MAVEDFEKVTKQPCDLLNKVFPPVDKKTKQAVDAQTLKIEVQSKSGVKNTIEACRKNDKVNVSFKPEFTITDAGVDVSAKVGCDKSLEIVAGAKDAFGVDGLALDLNTHLCCGGIKLAPKVQFQNDTFNAALNFSYPIPNSACKAAAEAVEEAESAAEAVTAAAESVAEGADAKKEGESCGPEVDANAVFAFENFRFGVSGKVAVSNINAATLFGGVAYKPGDMTAALGVNWDGAKQNYGIVTSFYHDLKDLDTAVALEAGYKEKTFTARVGASYKLCPDTTGKARFDLDGNAGLALSTNVNKNLSVDVGTQFAFGDLANQKFAFGVTLKN